MGAIAVSRGRKALRHARENPQDKGKAHAYVGIGCGAIGFLFNAVWLLIFIGLLLNSSHRP